MRGFIGPVENPDGHWELAITEVNIPGICAINHLKNLSGGVAMRSSLSKYFVAGFVGIAGLAVASPSIAAGRCGGALSIDAPTTLSRVAMRCNVNLSELYEANPGVDPSNVRPGERLAIPEERDRYASGSSSSQVTAPTPVEPSDNSSSHPYIVPQDYEAPEIDDHFSSISDAEAYRTTDTDRTQSVRVRDARFSQSSSSPSWRRQDSNGAALYSSNGRLSYQKMSAMRIHNAGVTSVDQPMPITVTKTPLLKSTALAKTTTKLIECNTLEESVEGKIHQVNRIISTPDKTFVEINASPDGDGFDCRLIDASAKSETVDGAPISHFTGPVQKMDYHLPDYSRIGVRPQMVRIGNGEFSLSGEVTETRGDCMMLKTKDNRIWRLASQSSSTDLIGKQVTVWGKPRVSSACNGGASMVISHAVYAEPLR